MKTLFLKFVIIFCPGVSSPGHQKLSKCSIMSGMVTTSTQKLSTNWWFSADRLCTTLPYCQSLPGAPSARAPSISTATGKKTWLDLKLLYLAVFLSSSSSSSSSSNAIYTDSSTTMFSFEDATRVLFFLVQDIYLNNQVK